MFTRSISSALHELVELVHALRPVHDVVHVEVEAARVDARRRNVHLLQRNVHSVPNVSQTELLKPRCCYIIEISGKSYK